MPSMVAQADIQAVGEHDQPRRDRLVIGQRDLLPLRAGLDADRLGIDAISAGRDLVADGVDEAS